MPSWRTPEGEKKYNEYKLAGGLTTECNLCTKEAVKTFQYWKICENTFPYDQIASIHHILIPLRHTKEYELTQEEIAELQELKGGVVNDGYDFILEATSKTKSIPNHFHLHLVTVKN